MIDGYRSLAYAPGVPNAQTGVTSFPQRPVEAWLVSLTQTMTIGLAVGNRIPLLRIADVYDNTLAAFFGPPLPAGAPTTHLVHWASGIPDAVEAFAGYAPWQSVVNIPIPVNLWMPPGYTPVCGLFAPDGGDSLGPASAIFLERESPDARNRR